MERVTMEFFDHFDRLCHALRHGGALLVVQDGEGRANPMTIGWATVGVVWGMPVMTVLVRPSRYTFRLLEAAACFTVNVPDEGMADALAFCGSRSGRDVDKIDACGLTAVPGLLGGTAVVAEAAWFYECRVLHRNDVDPSRLVPAVREAFYQGKDFHRVYFGEIVHAYRRDRG